MVVDGSTANVVDGAARGQEGKEEAGGCCWIDIDHRCVNEMIYMYWIL